MNNVRIIWIREQYLKPFIWVQIKLFVFDRNTWNHLTECKLTIIIKYDYFNKQIINIT